MSKNLFSISSRKGIRWVSLLMLLMLLSMLVLVFISIVFKYKNEQAYAQRILKTALSDVMGQYSPFYFNISQFNKATATAVQLSREPFDLPDSTNLLRNGCFDEGGYGVETELNEVRTNLSRITRPQDQGSYIIISDPQLIAGNWFGTPRGDSGAFLFVDGSQDSNVVVWRERVRVQPQTRYVFQFYLSNASAPTVQINPLRVNQRWQKALIQPVLNGKPLVASFAPDSVASWWRYTQVWESKSDTTLVIELYDRNSIGLYNDFSLDDITLHPLPVAQVPITTQPCPDQHPVSLQEEDAILIYHLKDYLNYRNCPVSFTVLRSDLNEFEMNAAQDLTIYRRIREQYIYDFSKNEKLTEEVVSGADFFPISYRLGKQDLILFRINNYSSYLFAKVENDCYLFLVIIAIAVLMFVTIVRFLRRNQELNLLKYSIINNVNHELKTPVAVILAAGDALEKYSFIDDKEKTRQYLKMMRVQAERINTLVDRSLQIYAIEEDDFQLQLAPVHLSALLQEVVTMWQQTHPDQLQLELELPTGEALVRADRFHLINIINTLIDNAVKHSGLPVVRVWLWLQISGNKALITVRDNGQGIKQAYQKKVFDKFYQVPLDGQQKSKGYGLGLHYVKSIVRLHNGKVLLTSDGVCGTDVQLQLPLYGQITAR